MELHGRRGKGRPAPCVQQGRPEVVASANVGAPLACARAGGSCGLSCVSCSRSECHCDGVERPCEDIERACDRVLRECDRVLRACDRVLRACDRVLRACDRVLREYREAVRACGRPVRGCSGAVRQCRGVVRGCARRCGRALAVMRRGAPANAPELLVSDGCAGERRARTAVGSARPAAIATVKRAPARAHRLLGRRAGVCAQLPKRRAPIPGRRCTSARCRCTSARCRCASAGRPCASAAHECARAAHQCCGCRKSMRWCTTPMRGSRAPVQRCRTAQSLVQISCHRCGALRRMTREGLGGGKRRWGRGGEPEEERSASSRGSRRCWTHLRLR